MNEGKNKGFFSNNIAVMYGADENRQIDFINNQIAKEVMKNYASKYTFNLEQKNKLNTTKSIKRGD